jgi:tRNA-splicing ligase RtcB
MPTVINPRLISWASEIDTNTILQAEMTARLPVVYDHVALMPDAHLGIGATVGSVVATDSAVIPAAVGVDIGCGMAAVETDLTASDLPDNLAAFMPLVEQAVPAGVGQGNDRADRGTLSWLAQHQPRTLLDAKQRKTVETQMGSLGSGNHFVEVCLDESDTVWLVLHSGSRGIGNQLAKVHIDRAKRMARDLHLALEDPDLAYFVQGTPEFEHYIADMLWAQDYAKENRALMLARLMRAFFGFVGHGKVVDSTNCHHNFTERETFNGRKLWITRKGAIRADVGDKGIIPGSMGTRSFIVEGLGNEQSWNSCSHGAGRRLSRGAAKREFTPADLTELMVGKVWLNDRAKSLVDEIPLAYKDIDRVMADQTDLVRIVHSLSQVLNYKGT